MDTTEEVRKAFIQALERELGIKFDPTKSIVENVTEVDDSTGFFLEKMAETDANLHETLRNRNVKDYDPKRDWQRLCDTWNAEMRQLLHRDLANGKGSVEWWLDKMHDNWNVTMMGGYRAMQIYGKVVGDFIIKLYKSEQREAALKKRLNLATDKINQLERTIQILKEESTRLKNRGH